MPSPDRHSLLKARPVPGPAPAPAPPVVVEETERESVAPVEIDVSFIDLFEISASEIPRHIDSIRALAMHEIRRWEGFRGEAYDDATGRAVAAGDEIIGIVTIGYGCTDPEYAQPGNIISHEKALELLERDMDDHWDPVEDLLRASPKPLTLHQIAALWSFAFNVGGAAFTKSASVAGRVRVGDLVGAANGLLLYVYAGGRRMRGLANRRASERELFLTGVAEGAAADDGARLPPDQPRTDKPVWTRSSEIGAAGAGVTATVGIIGTLAEQLSALGETVQLVLIGLFAVVLMGGGWVIWRRIYKARVAEEG